MSELQISVEETGHLDRRLSVVVPTLQLEQDRKRRLADLAKKARLDGFRPGKVPVSVVEKLYGQSIWSEVVQESLQHSLAHALKEHALTPAGQPHIDLVKAERGQDLEYIAHFEIYPKVAAPEESQITLEKTVVTFAESDIDEVLARIRLQHAEWIEVPRAAGYGDQVTFDLLYAEGEGEPRKDLEWVLEEGKVPEGFNALIGQAAEGSFTTILPTNTTAEEAAKKETTVTVQIKRVCEAKLPELDEALIKGFGIEEGNLETLRLRIREKIQEEIHQRVRDKLKTQLLDHLVTNCVIEDLPKVLLDEEFYRLEADARSKMVQKAGQEPVELTAEKQEELREFARRRVTLGLLFNALIEKYQLKVDEVRLKQQAERLLSAFQFDISMRERLFKDERMMFNLRSSVLEDQLIDTLLDKVCYTEKPVDYKEFMSSEINQ